MTSRYWEAAATSGIRVNEPVNAPVFSSGEARKALKRSLKASRAKHVDAAAEIAATGNYRKLTDQEWLAERGHLQDAAAADAQLQALKKSKPKRPKVKKPPLDYQPPAPRAAHPKTMMSPRPS